MKPPACGHGLLGLRRAGRRRGHNGRLVPERNGLPGLSGRGDRRSDHDLNTVLQRVNTKHVGTITEMALALCFSKQGFTVSLPWGENSPYDLVVDTGSRFVRVQCKTGRYVAGSIQFYVGSVCYSKETKTFARRVPVFARFDAYGIYCPDLDKSYLVPVESCRSMMRLRVDASVNGAPQRWAKDFDLEGEGATGFACLLNRMCP